MSKKRRGRALYALLGILVLAFAAVLLGSKVFVVGEVLVDGNIDIPDRDVVSLASIEQGVSLFLVDEHKVKNDVETSPYLQMTSMERRLPGTLVLKVKERRASAQVLYLETYMQISNEGILLSIVDTEAYMPKIVGLELLSFAPGKPLAVSDDYQYKVALAVLSALVDSALDYQIAEIDVTNTESVILKNYAGTQIRVGTTEDLGVKLARMKEILPMLAAEGQQLGMLDVTLKNPSYTPQEAMNIIFNDDALQDNGEPQDDEDPGETPVAGDDD